MKINPVRQFIKNNITRFEKNNHQTPSRIYNLYDKNNVYRGEYHYMPIHSSGFLGMKTSMTSRQIRGEDLKLQMQEYTYTNKDYVNLYNPKSEDDLKIKAFPTEIRTTTTVLDHVNDKFTTVRTVATLKNNLQRMTKDNPDFIWRDEFKVYEPLKEKPQYEKRVEYVRAGSLSETNKKANGHKQDVSPYGSVKQIPYRYW